jgi:hypothetical protein
LDVARAVGALASGKQDLRGIEAISVNNIIKHLQLSSI